MNSLYAYNPYIPLLEEFREVTGLVANEIEALIKNHNFESAQQKLHTLETSSKKVGADHLYAASQALQQCLEQDYVDPAIYQNFQEHLQENIAAINWIKIPKQNTHPTALKREHSD